MEPIEGSETSANINQTPGNYPKGNLLYSVHGESLKSRNKCCLIRRWKFARKYIQQTKFRVSSSEAVAILGVVLGVNKNLHGHEETDISCAWNFIQAYRFHDRV